MMFKISKYRIWDENEYKYFDIKSCSNDTSDLLVEFFIGQTDKHENLIYEGDVVAFKSLSYGTFAAPVEYVNHMCQFCLITYSHYKPIQLVMPNSWLKTHKPSACDGAMYEAQDIFRFTKDSIYKYPKNNKVEVIGNIHQTPEEIYKRFHRHRQLKEIEQ